MSATEVIAVSRVRSARRPCLSAAGQATDRRRRRNTQQRPAHSRPGRRPRRGPQGRSPDRRHPWTPPRLGSAAELGRLTDAPIACHIADLGIYQAGRGSEPYLPIGLFGRHFARTSRVRETAEPLEPDGLIRGETHLSDFGVEARILPTPGRTAGLRFAPCRYEVLDGSTETWHDSVRIPVICPMPAGS